VRLLDRIAVGTGPYAVATTADGALWATLVHAGRLRRNDSEIDLGAGSGPQLLAVDGRSVHVSCTDDTVASVGPDGSVRSLALPPGTKPYGVATTPGRLWFSGLADVVGRREPSGEVLLENLPAGSMPGALCADGETVWGTCFGGDALLRWRVGSAVELLPLGGGHGPVGIAADAHGLRWAEITSGTLGLRAADGRIRRVTLPGSRPHAVLPDGDGGTFVTCWGSDSLVHVDAADRCRTLSFDPGDEPHGLCRDADGRVVVALESGYLAVVEPVRTGLG
jgi:virginiamycin B lyase